MRNLCWWQVHRGLVSCIVLIFSIQIIFSVSSCEQKHSFEKEIGSNDSLVFDLKFGETKESFHKKCWAKNKEGILTHSEKMMIQYDWIDENKDIRMEFYPDFIDNKIVGMKMYFSYKGWAIWNEDLHSDQLIKHVDKLFMKWYGGNEFQKIVKKDYTFWVKKDSRKIIKMKTEGNRSVLVHIIDKLAKT